MFTPEQLTCERLTHAKRAGVTQYPHKCGLPSARYKVSGGSFSTVAVLCPAHAALAKREGLTLEVMPEDKTA